MNLELKLIRTAGTRYVITNYTDTPFALSLEHDLNLLWVRYLTTCYIHFENVEDTGKYVAKYFFDARKIK